MTMLFFFKYSFYFPPHYLLLMMIVYNKFELVSNYLIAFLFHIH